MPSEMEEIFREADVPLFPTRNALRRFKCTCPDDASPCKHIIAVLLILAEELEDDPFILLRLRGLDKESLINLLTLENTPSIEAAAEDEPDYEWSEESDELIGGSGEVPAELPIAEDIPAAGDDWYKAGTFTFERPEADIQRRAAALGVMNDFPFWRGEHPFRQMLAPYYENAAVYAGEILTGEKKKPVGRPRKII